AHRSAIADSVRATLDQWTAAFNARDVARVTAFYATDSSFRWVENGALEFTTARQLADSMTANLPSLAGVTFRLDHPEIVALAPGVAEVVSGFTQQVVSSPADTFGIVGALTMTVVHADSGWRFLISHTSLYRPEGAAAAPPSRRGD